MTSTGAGRSATVERTTKETRVEVRLDLDGAGTVDVATGVPFFDHMLDQLGRHGGFDLVVKADGDLEIDAHHTVEDTGIVLGQAFKQALGDKRGVRRFASIAVPLDEALVDAVVDLSGRPFVVYELPVNVERIGTFDPQLMEEFWRAFAVAAGVTLHVNLRYGKNAHHIVEASVKGVARALRDAVRIEGSALPSTKGVL